MRVAIFAAGDITRGAVTLPAFGRLGVWNETSSNSQLASTSCLFGECLLRFEAVARVGLNMLDHENSSGSLNAEAQDLN